MKMQIAVWTPKGFYAERQVAVDNVKNGLDQVIHILEKMPDTIDDEKQHEWVRIQVEFTK